MCTKTISFTIPMEKGALRHTADMLNRLAAEAGPAVVTKGQQPGPTVAVDTVAAFNNDTPEAMGDRIDEAAAAGMAPPAPPAETDVELDAEGLPWDARIHSSGKTFLKNGNWRIKGGVDPALVEKVRTEYLSAKAAGAPTPAPPAPAPVAETPVPPAPAPAAPTPPPPVEESGLHSFEDFKDLVMERIQGAGLQPSDLQTAVTMAGSTASGMMPSIQNETPEMIDAIYKQLVALWAERDSKAA